MQEIKVQIQVDLCSVSFVYSNGNEQFQHIAYLVDLSNMEASKRLILFFIVGLHSFALALFYQIQFQLP